MPQFFMESNVITNKKIERNSAFELLRIIAIIFIIAHHFAYHGAFDFSQLDNTALITINRIWINYLNQAGKLGVNIFVLISGYFLVEGKFKTRKVLSLLIEMILFSLVLGLTFFFVYEKEFSETFLKSLIFPFGSEIWWFMTSYLLLYIFSPLLNLAIKAMKRKMHLFFCVFLMIIWSIIPTFLRINYGFTTFGWFLTLYLIASYVRLYDFNIKVKPWLGIIISIAIFIGGASIRFIFQNYLDTSNFFVNKVIGWFYYIDINNFVQFAAAFVLFLSFKKLKMKKCSIINIVASTCLVIYLFHDHRDIRKFLWIDLFKNATFASSPYLILYSIGAILAVFAAGVVIGLIYRYSIALLVNKALNFLDKKFLFKLDAILNNKNE